MDRHHMIVAAEEQFAREVTLGVIVQRPMTVWHYIIPGMFIIDYLRRGSAISQYTKHFMFPRKLALDAARALLEGQDKTSVTSQIEDDISTWLNSLNLYSQELLHAQTVVVDLLMDHYLKLLKTDGDTYLFLIKNAYKNRGNYKALIDELTSAEEKVDGKIIEKIGKNKNLKEKLLAEQQQVAKRRQNIMDEIF
ncbi:MAG: NF038143 family protein [Desulfobacterales bacterium]